jgi:rhamnosyltransferase subunit B
VLSGKLVSRIVLTTIGSLGDLHPKIAIALELRNRGHNVVFATHQEYQSIIEALGFEFYRMRPDASTINGPEGMAQVMDLRKGAEFVVKWVCGNLRETYTDLMAAAKNADFILAGEIVYAARLVAETLGIKWALCVLQPTSFFSAYDPPIRAELPFLTKLRVFGVGVNRAVVNFGKFITHPWAEPIHQLRAELGLPKLSGNPVIDDKYSPNLTLALLSPVVVKPQPDWPQNTLLTGFTFYDGSKTREITPELQHFLNSGKAPIIFTLGSAAVTVPGNFYQESIEAVKLLKHRAILLIGENLPPKNLPENILAVDYAPYSQIFPYASVIVHQGGIGTTAQALRAGRPTLVVPYSHDQPDNAARVERLGTSRTINRNQYLAPKVVNELRELLENQNYLTKALQIANIIQAEDGAIIACDAIEKQGKFKNV